MAVRSFSLATEPHVANVGDHTLRFTPEASATAFMDAFATMRERMQAAGANDAGEGGDPEEMLAASVGFLATFAHDDETTSTLEAAPLPLRVLGQLTNWLISLYGSGEDTTGGDAARPTGSSGGSQRPSRRTGTASTRSSSSKASTSTRSRRAG